MCWENSLREDQFSDIKDESHECTFQKDGDIFLLNLDLSLIDSANNQIDQSEEKLGYVKKHTLSLRLILSICN